LATELAETTHEYVVSFDVPGMDLNNIDVTLGGNTLTINGVRTGLQATSALAYSEIARGNISRSVALPFDVSAHKAINTSLENGVLKIRISKEDQAGKKATRKINLG
jgi:HSP20 family protein